MDDSLRYLLAVDEYGNLSRAAESLFISQPALSRYIARLEDSVGARLIDRGSRPLCLTPQGQRYRDYLQGVEQLRTAMEADLEGMAQTGVESVRLGATQWRSSMVLPEIIPAVLRAHPQLRITIFEGSNSQLHAGVKARKLDLAMMNAAQAGSGVQYERVVTERVVLVGRALQELLGCRADQSAGEVVLGPSKVKTLLQNTRLLLLHPEHHMGAISRDFLTVMGVRQARVMNTHNITTAVRLAARGAGLAFAPEGIVQEVGGLPYVYIEHPGLVQDVGLAWPVGAEPTAGTSALAQELRPAIRSMVRP